jgi:hypothetical protein
MITAMESRAIKDIKKSADVEIPPNQMAMPQYYSEKIRYLEDAINILEKQIEEYNKERRDWIRGNMGNSNTNYNSNATVGVGGKRRKTRKMKRL